MPVYRYKVRDPQGRLLKGEAAAADELELKNSLGERGLFLIECDRTRERGEPASKRKGPQVRVKDTVLSFWCWQMYTALDAGVPIVQALAITGKQVSDEAFRGVLAEVRKSLEEGASFSEALAAFPRTFSPMFVNMVRAGEVASALPEMIHKLAVYLEKQATRRGQILGAMAYPAVLLAICALVVSFLLVFVVPRFAGMFRTSGRQLPLPTQLLMDAGAFTKANALYLLIGFVGLVAGWRLFLASRRGRLFWDRVKLGIPLAGKMMHKMTVSRFGDTLSTLVISGVPIMESLSIVADTVGNAAMTQVLKESQEKVKEGKAIGDTLAQSPLFPELMVSMIRIGEETGELGEMMRKVSDYLDREVDQSIRVFSKLIEPVMLVFITGLIGGIAISILLPMAELTTGIGKQ